MIELINISKHFETSDGTVVALNDVSLEINDGDIYGNIGVSGAGKSTLVRGINMLEKPTQGTVRIDGIDLKTLTEKQLREKRREISMISRITIFLCSATACGRSLSLTLL